MTVSAVWATSPDPSTAIGAAASGPTTPVSVTDTGFRYQPGPGVPEYLHGKTPIEAAALTEQLRQALVNSQPRQPQAMSWQQSQQVQYPTQQPIQQLRPPTQDDYTLDPYAATQQHIAYVAQTQFAPALQQATANARLLARSVGEMRHKDD